MSNNSIENMVKKYSKALDKHSLKLLKQCNYNILKIDVEKVVNYMRQKQIDLKAFFDYLIDALELLESRNIQVENVHVNLAEDGEDVNWKAIDITIKVKSEDYDTLISLWTELAKMKPKAWKSVYIGVEPL